MRILILSQYFKPETFIINDLVLEMEQQGHNVTVLTGQPNYPDGKIFEGYTAFSFESELTGNAIEVIRVPLRPRGRGGAINLFLNYVSFVLSASIFGPYLLRKRSFDVIFVFAPSPITSAIPGVLLKFIKKSFLTVWVLDLWPQSLQATGFIKNGIILKFVELVVKVIYKWCDVILTQSPAFFKPILEISPDSEIVYFPNSYKLSATESLKELPEELNKILAEEFCVVFAGNIGKAQSVETIVEACKLLEDLPQLKIVFVGSGSMLAWVQEQRELYKLDNIFCAGRYESSYMSTIFEKARVLLLTLNADEIFRYTLPWKTQAYMAAKKPIVGAIDGEGARVLMEANCGFVGPAQDSKALAENIRKAYNCEPEVLSDKGLSGYHYFISNFEMKKQIEKLLMFLEDRTRS